MEAFLGVVIFFFFNFVIEGGWLGLHNINII